MKLISHPQILEVKIANGRNIFPISWLNKQAYCEYQIYLENVKGVVVDPSTAMVEGKLEHDRLENEFLEYAESSTLDMLYKIFLINLIRHRQLKLIKRV